MKIKEPTLQRRHPGNGLKDTSGVLAVDMEKKNLKITPKVNRINMTAGDSCAGEERDASPERVCQRSTSERHDTKPRTEKDAAVGAKSRTAEASTRAPHSFTPESVSSASNTESAR